MTRGAAGVLAATVLCVGVVIGLAAGGLAVGPPGSDAVPGSATPGAPSSQAASLPSRSPLQTPTSSPAPSATASPIPLPTPSPTPALVAAPLTGTLVAESVARRHVIAVMIDDQAGARPQSGLSAASVVWQAPAEGGIPRYMALFGEGDPPAVGPVRSSRLYFIAWAAEWNAVYVHVGGSPQALALLHSSQGKGSVVYDADEFRWGGRFLWRIKTRNAPHNVYSDAKNLQALAKAVGAKPVASAPAWTFAPDADPAQRPVGGTIVVPYLENTITYRYDRTTNRYLRSVTGERTQVDAGTKEQIGPKNVVIVFMNFRPLKDGSKKHRLEAQFTGSGVAYVATNGRTIKGTWKKRSLTAPTLFLGPDGKPATLTIGQTFVQVVKLGTRITISDGKVPSIPLPPQGLGGRPPPEDM